MPQTTLSQVFPLQPPPKDMRIAALRRFAFAITLLNVLGHAFLGFEQSLAQPLAALATAYGMELAIETLAAWRDRRAPRYRGGLVALSNFLLSPHITGLAVAMLLYASDRVLPIALAAAIAIASKAMVRFEVDGCERHLLNPSNFGITMVLLLFPWVGIAPPYHFTEGLVGSGDWLLPVVVIGSGSFLNTRFTRRVPLIAAWAGGFFAQAFLRSLLFDTQLAGALLPMTGMAFLLFSFYMVTDPATTPKTTRGQVAFGLAVAATYGVLVSFHVVFGLFFSLTTVTLGRGVALYVSERRRRAALASDAPFPPAGRRPFLIRGGAALEPARRSGAAVAQQIGPSASAEASSIERTTSKSILAGEE